MIGDGPCIRVTVAETRGSTPREVGARMLVWKDRVAETIGGGRLEWSAIREARRLLGIETAEPASEIVVTLGPDVGQCCGGQVRLRFERVSDSSCRQESHPLQPLYLFGAGHVGKAVVRVLADLPFDITWVDSRAELFPTELPANAARRPSDEPACVVASAPTDAFYLVMTHSHPLDLEICARVLQRGDFAYLGLIGSETKRARFAGRLRAIGHSADAISRITCPIGVPGIASKAPAAIAVSVAAQLLMFAERWQAQSRAPRLAAGRG